MIRAAIQEETADWCEAHKDSGVPEPEDILEDPTLQKYLHLKKRLLEHRKKAGQ